MDKKNFGSISCKRKEMEVAPSKVHGLGAMAMAKYNRGDILLMRRPKRTDIVFMNRCMNTKCEKRRNCDGDEVHVRRIARKICDDEAWERFVNDDSTRLAVSEAVRATFQCTHCSAQENPKRLSMANAITLHCNSTGSKQSILTYDGFTVKKGSMCWSTRCENREDKIRCINASCSRPNCSVTYDHESNQILVVCTRQVQRGEELLWDYGRNYEYTF